MKFNLVSALACVLLLASCAETQLATHIAKRTFDNHEEGTFKVGKPYDVEGKTYVPQETYSYSETGIASWYGPGFDGKRTANGERFDSNELTGAHRTLQMPSLVRVTNLDNGRSLVLRINDRGPFRRGRVIDVSARAAQLLGFKGIGTAKVRLDLLPEESRKIASSARSGMDTTGYEVGVNNPAAAGYSNAPLTTPEQATFQTASYNPQTAPVVPGHMRNGEFMPDPVVKQFAVTPTNIYVQAGSFGQQANAAKLASNLRNIAPAQVFPANINGRTFFRVRLGPLPNVDAADRLLSRLASMGHKNQLLWLNNS